MVFEHLQNPEIQLREIFRVLRSKGKLIFHTPNKLSYSTILARLTPQVFKDKLVYLLQGRSEEDVFPAFYKINSKSTIQKLARQSGLRIKEIKLVCSTAQMAIIPPLAFLELLWIKLLMTKPFTWLRPNIIAILEKSEEDDSIELLGPAHY